MRRAAALLQRRDERRRAPRSPRSSRRRWRCRCAAGPSRPPGRRRCSCARPRSCPSAPRAARRPARARASGACGQFRPDPVEVRRVGERDGVALAGRAEAPAIQNAQHDRPHRSSPASPAGALPRRRRLGKPASARWLRGGRPRRGLRSAGAAASGTARARPAPAAPASARVASSPRRRRSSKSARPSGVRSTISRRRSSALGTVVTSRRVTSRPTTPLIVAASIAVARPSWFCDIGPSSASLRERRELRRRHLRDHLGEDRQVALVDAAQQKSDLLVEPVALARPCAPLDAPRNPPLARHIDRSRRRPQTICTHTKARRSLASREPAGQHVLRPPRHPARGAGDPGPRAAHGAGRRHRPLSGHHRAGARGRGARHHRRSASSPASPAPGTGSGSAPAPPGPRSATPPFRPPSTPSAPPPPRSAAARSRTPAPSAATSATPPPPPTASRRSSRSTPRSSSPRPTARRRLPLARLPQRRAPRPSAAPTRSSPPS